jgi:hypothetical protein
MINQPAQDGNSAGKLASAAPIVKQAIVLVSIVIALGLAWTAAAQQRTGCEVSASTLKQQLLELKSKETRLRMRLEELNEQLKPASIERDLAGIGSVHPEELREHRRKLLTIERNGLQAQIRAFYILSNRVQSLIRRVLFSLDTNWTRQNLVAVPRAGGHRQTLLAAFFQRRKDHRRRINRGYERPWYTRFLPCCWVNTRVKRLGS